MRISMKNKVKAICSKTMYLIAVLFIVFGNMGGLHTVSATTQAAQEIPVTFSNKRISQNGKQLIPDKTFKTDDTVLDLDMNFVLNNIGDIHKGDYFVLDDIPTVFRDASALGTTVNITDSETSDTMATGTYDHNNPGKIIFYFAKDMTRKNITGSIHLAMAVNANGGSVNFIYNNNHYIIEKNGGSGGNSDSHIDYDVATLEKNNYSPSYDQNTNLVSVNWLVYFNAKGLAAGTYTFSDELPEYMTFDSSSKRASRGHKYATADSHEFLSEEDILNSTSWNENNGNLQISINVPQNSDSVYALSYKTTISLDDPNFDKLLYANNHGDIGFKAHNSIKVADALGQELANTSRDATMLVSGSGIAKYDKAGSAKISKIDVATQAPLSGAIFNLIDSQNSVVKSITTDTYGTETVYGLTPGQYSWVETSAPTGYELDSTPIPVTVAAGKVALSTATDKKGQNLGSVVLTKKAAKDGTKLPNASFNLQKADGTFVKSVTTGVDGAVTVDHLLAGDYQFIETKAPDGYTLDAKPIPFTIEKNQTTAKEVTATDEETSGSVVLSKVDADTGKTLPGAIFELDTAAGKRVKDQLVTDKTGEIFVDKLLPGDYQFIEKTAPTGYTLDSQPIAFTIEKGQTTAKQVKVTNKATPGSVVLTKKDAETAEVLPDAVFELQKSDGTTITTDLTTDASGKISVDSLEPGDYQFVEMVAPTGYEIDKTPVKFTITKAQATALQVVKTNRMIKGTVILDKADSRTGTKLAGATFKLINKDTKKIVMEEMTTSQSGRLAVQNLRPGHYQFIETKAPKGYELDAKPVEFTIIRNQKDTLYLTKINKAIKGLVRLEKRDSQSKKLLTGASFNLLDDQGKIIKKDLVTDKNGVVEIAGLDVGHYQFVETKAPKGYELDASPVNFTLDDNSSNVAVTKFDTSTPVAPHKAEQPKTPARPAAKSKSTVGKTVAKASAKPATHSKAKVVGTAKAPNNATYKAYPKTGEEKNSIVPLIGGIVVVGIGVFGLMKKKVKSEK